MQRSKRIKCKISNGKLECKWKYYSMQINRWMKIQVWSIHFDRLIIIERWEIFAWYLTNDQLFNIIWLSIESKRCAVQYGCWARSFDWSAKWMKIYLPRTKTEEVLFNCMCVCFTLAVEEGIWNHHTHIAYCSKPYGIWLWKTLTGICVKPQEISCGKKMINS